MDKLQVLRDLDVGGVVAEQDRLLIQCFVRHPVLTEVINDRKDLVLGAKGAGKSALWKELLDRQVDYPSVHDVHLRLVTNPTGDPEFRDVLRAMSGATFPDDDELRVGWRLYFLAQCWQAATKILPNDDREVIALDKRLKKLGVVHKETGQLKAAFAYALAKARALKNMSVEWTKGISLEFSDEALRAGGSAAGIPFNDLFAEINRLLRLHESRIWLVLDRLDEIILGDEERENVVLKGLLLAFRDVSDHNHCRVKIFLRDDVYNRVTTLGHFPALTHVRSRAAGPIRWTLEDLLNLVTKRLLANEGVVQLANTTPLEVRTSEDRRRVFYTLFPEKVDKGRAAEGFKWIFDRLVDGNNVVTPRDVLSVIDAARTIQIEQLEREGSTILDGGRLFTEDTLRKAVRKVAEDNLQTRIYAEYPDLVDPIRAFEGGKADHNDDTLRALLGETYQVTVKRLERVGVLYRRRRQGVDMWTIPFFYSFALDAKRGAAFHLPNDEEEEDR